jgi:hypothetical protein
MTQYRVTRLWLDGDRAGTTETFVDALPGFPADIAADGRGGYWLSLYAPRIDALDRLAEAPWLRGLWFKLPRAWQPKPRPQARVLGLDASGRVTQDLQFHGEPAYAPIVGVLAHDENLYLGSPLQKGVLQVRLPKH